MNENDEDFAAVEDWKCPACDIDTNRNSEPFTSSRAVALHVAGKIMRARCSLHKSWALNTAGESINEPSVKQTINTLAAVLEWHVAEANRNRREAKQQKFSVEGIIQGFQGGFQRIKEQTADEPSVQAHKLIIEIETTLSKFVRRVLEEELAEDEDGWWLEGIPENIRIDCAKRREEDKHRKGHAYNYTYLIDKKTIIDKRWKIFEPHFRPHVQSKSELLQRMARLNDLRNIVSHPSPEISVSNDDLSFLCQFRDLVQSLPDTE